MGYAISRESAVSLNPSAPANPVSEPRHKARRVTLSSPKNQVKTVRLLESCCSEWVPVPDFFGILRKLRIDKLGLCRGSLVGQFEIRER